MEILKKVFLYVSILSFYNINISNGFDELDLKQLLETNICINCDLSGADLRKKNLSNANIQGSNLNKVNLWRANLENANLSGCSIEEANLRRVNFKNANLNDTTFQWSIIRHAEMDGATAINADFRRAGIKKTSFKLVILCNTYMKYGLDNSGCIND